MTDPTPTDPTPTAPTDPTRTGPAPADSTVAAAASDGVHGPHAPETLARKPDIDGAAFFDLDLRVGEVVAVTAFPEARRPAWKLEVDFGPLIGILQTSAQITNYAREELLGRRVVGAVNLGAKRIAGFRSEFLVLGGLQPDGTVLLLDVDGALDPGAPIA